MTNLEVEEVGPDISKSEKNKLPPGQAKANRWPILHVEGIPEFNGKDWPISVTGLVENEISWTWDEFKALPRFEQETDLHCVTAWSLLDQNFAGVSFKTILEIVKPLSDAKYVTFEAKSGYTTSLPLTEGFLLESDVMLAYEHEGNPLDPEHGGPLRSLVPQLYLWKSVKWLVKIHFEKEWIRGYWETRGYHQVGRPWLEERFSSDEKPRRRDHFMKDK